MFNPDDHQPHTHEADFFSPKTDSNLIQLYKSAGNICEFASYFSTGLMIAFLCRGLSALMFYALAVIAVAVYLWIVQRDAEPHKQKGIWAIGLALTLSVAGAFWDALYQLIRVILTLANAFTWLGVALFVIGLIALWFSSRSKQ